jgi:hypothetical protein
LENWFDVEFIFLKVFRLPPDKLDALEFYRAELLMEKLKEWNEKENNQHKKREEDQAENMPKFDQSSMMRDANKMMKVYGGKLPTPSLPNLGGMKL